MSYKVTEEMFCNICGKSFELHDKYERFHIYKKCGYGTIYDGDFLELDICCDCIEKIVDKCSIFPIKTKEDLN